jgi:hypothetical protein
MDDWVSGWASRRAGEWVAEGGRSRALRLTERGATPCAGRRQHLYFIHVRKSAVPCHALLVRVNVEDALQVSLDQVISGRHHAVWRDAVLASPVERRPEGVALLVIRLQIGTACGQHACLHAERLVPYGSAP